MEDGRSFLIDDDATVRTHTHEHMHSCMERERERHTDTRIEGETQPELPVYLASPSVTLYLPLCLPFRTPVVYRRPKIAVGSECLERYEIYREMSGVKAEVGCYLCNSKKSLNMS